MAKPKQHTFRVAIKQEDWSASVGNEFGSPEEWAKSIEETLNKGLKCAEVVEVKPTKR